MKIIRPEQPQNNVKTERQEKLDELTRLSQECGLYNDELVDDNNSKNDVEKIMDSVLKQVNGVTFEITLTNRQYELWNKKGGLKWLKKKLTGQK